MMGDCGSYLLGSSLGILSIIGLSSYQELDITASSSNLSGAIKIFPIGIAILIFFVPLIDMCCNIYKIVKWSFTLLSR